MKTLALSARAGMLKPSPTLSIAAKANALRAQGVDIIPLGAGEPDFDTPEPIREAAIQALRDGLTKYTPTAGLPKLREAISAKLERENQVKASPDQIVVTCGAKQAIYEAAMVLLDPGDEVLLLAPYWMTYAEQILLAGGVPVVVHCNPSVGFTPDYEALRAAITPCTKAIIVNSPCNPTGTLYDRDTIKEIAQLAIRHDLWVISDEIYDRLVYGAAHVSIASLGREVADRTITIGGCSKTYAMTGWRIGFAAAPLEVAKALSNLQDQVTSNATSFAQVGAIRALEMGAEEIEPMRAEFGARRDLIVDLLGRIPGVELVKPQGAFYVLPSFRAYLGGRVADDAGLVEYFLDRAKVATVPGSVFEAHGHVRISYAASREQIEEGIARIGEALETLGT